MREIVENISKWNLPVAIFDYRTAWYGNQRKQGVVDGLTNQPVILKKNFKTFGTQINH